MLPLAVEILRLNFQNFVSRALAFCFGACSGEVQASPQRRRGLRHAMPSVALQVPKYWPRAPLAQSISVLTEWPWLFKARLAYLRSSMIRGSAQKQKGNERGESDEKPRVLRSLKVACIGQRFRPGISYGVFACQWPQVPQEEWVRT